MKVNDRETGKGRASQRSSAAATEDYDVGYRKPPRQHQFKKGQSGNKRGRRKGTQNMLGVFKKIADEKVKVRIAGESHVHDIGTIRDPRQLLRSAQQESKCD